ncbi:hypothetical protein MPH_00695 [Macrophomina phaseolina MS6]|uniref:Uncharacterized protein n=1 Tax=Macrophomina phaseolina (strain MS6) TaxID=1126212 RepID=K2SHP1_MACPH|nr:hypothetical protein MPH_00695 [Macrophomina phaseolina MS6]
MLLDGTLTGFRPQIHIVQFDAQHKITSIRLHWDQASLLKQVDVIGARARNWPIREAKDQIRIITACAAGAPATSGASSRRNTSAGDSEEGSRPQTSRSNTSVTGDPHASLALFEPREDEERPQTPSEYSVERVKSVKPAPRQLHEIISPEHQAPERSASPAKAGAAKHFHPIRLFDEPGEQQENGKAERGSLKPNPKKYEHFDFGEGEEAPQADQRPTSKSKKHTSQWDFESFATPEQTRTKVLPQHTKQLVWSDDEDAEDSPVKRPVVHQPRKDARTHFDFDDEATPQANKIKHVSGKGSQHNKGLGLYKELDAHGGEHSHNDGPLSDVSKNVNNEKRAKVFGSSFDITDESPNPSHISARPGDENANKLPETKKKVLKSLDPNWELAEPAVPKERGINIGGDGMGGKKGTRRDWLFGDDEVEQEPETRSITGRKLNTKQRNVNQHSEKGSFWDF